MTPDRAADLAARTLAAIDAQNSAAWAVFPGLSEYCRERVASDLAGLRSCRQREPVVLIEHADHALRYAEGLKRTAALYGVQP